jgi:hypothetical protein
MISKERLEELIEQGATIYSSHIFDSKNGIKLSSQHFEASCEGLVFKYKIYVILYCDLWETKEEADFVVEELKAWKRLKDAGFRFEGWWVPEGRAIEIGARFNKTGIKKDFDLLFGGEE